MNTHIMPRIAFVVLLLLPGTIFGQKDSTSSRLHLGGEFGWIDGVGPLYGMTVSYWYAPPGRSFHATILAGFHRNELGQANPALPPGTQTSILSGIRLCTRSDSFLELAVGIGFDKPVHAKLSIPYWGSHMTPGAWLETPYLLDALYYEFAVCLPLSSLQLEFVRREGFHQTIVEEYSPRRFRYTTYAFHVAYVLSL